MSKKVSRAKTLNKYHNVLVEQGEITTHYKRTYLCGVKGIGRGTTGCRPSKGQKPGILLFTILVKVRSEKHLYTKVMRTHL